MNKRNFDNHLPGTTCGFTLINAYVGMLAVLDEPIVAGDALRPSRAQLETAYGAERIQRDIGDTK